MRDIDLSFTLIETHDGETRGAYAIVDAVHRGSRWGAQWAELVTHDGETLMVCDQRPSNPYLRVGEASATDALNGALGFRVRFVTSDTADIDRIVTGR